jgi:hypothetical protein
MVRSMAVGFGVVTALAVAGSLTPAGQAMLGFRHPESTTPVTAIEDKSAPVPSPVQSLQSGTAGSAPATPAARPTPPSVQGRQPVPGRPAPAQPSRQSAPQPGGAGGLAGVANILLNLPQVLDQTHVGPAGPSQGSDSWSEPRPDKKSKKKHYDQDEDTKNKGEEQSR